ncbi:MAG: lamin tail domain-containing protein [Candidatus Bipolaricaulota bacterium]
MKKTSFKYLCITILVFSLLGGIALGEKEDSIRITEIAWSGTQADSEDQWMELTNYSDSEVDLSGWELSWGEGYEEVKVPLGEEDVGTFEVKDHILEPGKAYLLELKDDETVATHEADVIYEGFLFKSGEKIVLKDDSGTEVDVVDASDGWPAGTDAEGEPPNASMELRDGDWVTCEEPGEHEDADGNPIYGSPGTPNEEQE